MSNHSTHYSTIVDILRDRALNQADQIVFTFLDDGKTEQGRLTYRELDQQARAIAQQLQSLTRPGDRALLVYPYNTGLEFTAAFFGCLYAGVVAVTDNPPRHSKALLKLGDRITSSQSTIALTTSSLLTKIKEHLAQNPDLDTPLRQISWIATDEVPSDIASDWVEMRPDPDTLAFLQYTSGSTGNPKGVMVTHGNILHNSKVIAHSFEHSPQTRSVIWLPLYHDMGLIGGIMQPIFGGLHHILMSPVALTQNPFRWLEAITNYQATTSGGPNFAYDLACQIAIANPEKLANLDLSSWNLAFSGAEPVRAQTIDRFSKIFAPCGFSREAFYPCYGMAETTLFISGGHKKEPPLIRYFDKMALENNQVIPLDTNHERARSVVACGKTWLGDKMLIVNPDTLTECPVHQVGEIWVAGKGVGQGYWNQPEETQRTFQAYLADTGEGPFLRTGDLGFIQDGEVYITGRIKDMMILWGRNHYPQHIEHTVETSHPALRANCGAAFSIDVEGEERLMIATEVERTYLRRLEIDEVVGAIRKAVAEQHLADIEAILFLKTGSIPKTSSGKIQRRACRTKFLEGSLDIIAQWHNDQSSNITTLGLNA
jgi:acyl-CoA synthetase (AMP-forming)/AMP-acid ligase II